MEKCKVCGEELPSQSTECWAHRPPATVEQILEAMQALPAPEREATRLKLLELFGDKK
jgi:DNA-directed RNA polymerase specialized sigma24 family protein